MKIVWFKRDLRLHDHEALHEALSTSGKTLLLYIFEPSLMKDYHYSQRHFDFIKQSLEALQKELLKYAKVHTFKAYEYKGIEALKGKIPRFYVKKLGIK